MFRKRPLEADFTFHVCLKGSWNVAFKLGLIMVWSFHSQVIFGCLLRVSPMLGSVVNKAVSAFVLQNKLFLRLCSSDVNAVNPRRNNPLRT